MNFIDPFYQFGRANLQCISQGRSMSDICVSGLGLEFLFVLLAILFHLWGRAKNSYKATDLSLIKARLGNYWNMLEAPKQGDSRKFDDSANDKVQSKGGYEENSKSDSSLLSFGEHKILLGVLKKIEAKNGNLARIWTFLGAACVASVYRTDDIMARVLTLLVIVYIMIFLVASLEGNRQIDQRDSSGKDLASMQRALIDDMLLKEANFQFSRAGAFFLLALVFFFAMAFIAGPFLRFECEQAGWTFCFR